MWRQHWYTDVFASAPPRGFTALAVPGCEPVERREGLLYDVDVLIVVGATGDLIPHAFPAAFLARRNATLRTAEAVARHGMHPENMAAAQVLPVNLDETHDGRHPEMTYRLMGARWQGEPLLALLPWRAVLEAVEGISEACTPGEDDPALILHLVCETGRHRSIAGAVLIGRVLHLLGGVVTMMVCDGDDDRRPPRLCRLRRCPCNCGPYPADWEIGLGTARYLMGVALSPVRLELVARALQQLAEACAEPPRG